MGLSVRDLVHQKGGLMDFIDYKKSYVDNNKEFLRGDMWEFRIVEPPQIVYWPDDDIFLTRLNNVNIAVDSSVSGFEKSMRGNYTLIQKTGQNTSGSLSLSFVDREDQAISYFVDDWKQKVSDRDTKYSFRKDDLVCKCTMTLANSGRMAVRTLTFYNCIIQDAPLDENGVDADGSDRSDVQLSLQCEHYERSWDNL